MKAPFLARKAHKWLALFVGVQAAFWMLSGAYMATIDIDFIHGDPLVKNLSESLNDKLSDLYPINAVLQRYPNASAVELVTRRGQPHYVVASAQGAVLLDGVSGEVRSPIGRNDAMQLAKHYYAGRGELADVTLLTDEATRPGEIQTRPLPLWQLRFDDRIDTTFYVSPSTGELITRRHTFWRLYDFLWMFHIMDYENRTDINNNLLRVAALIGFAFSLSGAWLMVYSLRRRKPETAGTDAVADDKHDLVPKTS